MPVSHRLSAANEAMSLEMTEFDGAEDESGDDGASVPGRRKIDISYIHDKQKRHISFSKRKAGIFKKAHELATLTGTNILLMIVSETGLVYTYTTPRLAPLINAREGQRLIQSCLNGTSDSASSEEAITPPLAADDPFGKGYDDHYDDSVVPFSPARGGQRLNLCGVKSPGSRALKKRKTNENLRQTVARQPTADGNPAPLMPELVHGDAHAPTAGIVSSNNSISHLMVAFESNLASQPSNGNALSDLAYVFHSLVQCMLASPSSSNEAPAIDPMAYGVEVLELVFARYFNDFLPSDRSQVDLITAQHLLSDWASWLYSNGHVDAPTRAALLKHCGRVPPPRRMASNSRLRQKTKETSPDDSRAAVAVAAIQEYAKEHASVLAGAGLLASKPINGCFRVLATSSTYVIVSQTGEGGVELNPEKLRLSNAGTTSLRLGDILMLSMARVLGDPETAHWVPTACTSCSPSAGLVEPSISAEEAQEMITAAEARRDSEAVNSAIAHWQRASRLEMLTAQGELLDDLTSDTEQKEANEDDMHADSYAAEATIYNISKPDFGCISPASPNLPSSYLSASLSAGMAPLGDDLALYVAD